MLNGQKEYRVEKDFLGEKQIEADVYYGIQTLRASENFPITGYKIHEEMINALAIVKKAAALANMDVKRLYEGIGQAIVQAADEILEGKWHDQFIVDPIQGGAGTSMNMNANEVIGNRALEIMGHKKGRLYPFKSKHTCEHVTVYERCVPDCYSYFHIEALGKTAENNGRYA